MSERHTDRVIDLSGKLRDKLGTCYDADWDHVARVALHLTGGGTYGPHEEMIPGQNCTCPPCSEES